MTNFISKYIHLTNMYVLVKKPQGDTATWIRPIPNYEIPKRAPVAVVDMSTNSTYEERKVTNLVEQRANLSSSVQNINSKDSKNKMSLITQNSQYSEISDLLHKTSLHTPEPITENSTYAGCSDSGKFHGKNQGMLSQDQNYGIQQNRKPNQVESESPEMANTSLCSHVIYEEHVNMLEMEEVKSVEFKIDTCMTETKTEPLNSKTIWYIASEYLPGFKQPVFRKK